MTPYRHSTNEPRDSKIQRTRALLHTPRRFSPTPPWASIAATRHIKRSVYNKKNVTSTGHSLPMKRTTQTQVDLQSNTETGKYVAKSTQWYAGVDSVNRRDSEGMPNNPVARERKYSCGVASRRVYWSDPDSSELHVIGRLRPETFVA